jgi:hypothetical protein
LSSAASALAFLATGLAIPDKHHVMGSENLTSPVKVSRSVDINDRNGILK